MATMTAEDRRLEVFCDDHSTFYFELAGSASTKRWVSTDPRDFHDYTKVLSGQGFSFAWA